MFKSVNKSIEGEVAEFKFQILTQKLQLFILERSKKKE